MTNKKISIIVPIHNSAIYLHKCIKSCLGQTLSEIEIILVDDASTDNSKDLIAAYVAQYPQKVIPIYLEENLRQGGARNRGIQIAEGEYLCFVDSDDWIEPDMCEQLYEAAKAQDADMAGGGFYYAYDNEEKRVPLDYFTAELGKNHPENVQAYLSEQGIFWNRIYRTSYIRDNGICFPEKVFYEDSYFNFMAALYANRVVKIEKCFYHYYQSPISTVRTASNTRIFDKILIAEQIAEDTRKNKMYDVFPAIIEDKIVTTFGSCLLQGCLGELDSPNIEKMTIIRNNIKKYCPQYKKNPYYKDMSVELRTYLYLLAISTKLVVFWKKHNLDMLIVYWNAALKKIKRMKNIN